MNKWTDKEINEAIKLLKDNLTYQEIGFELNRSSDSIRGKLQKLGYSYYVENKKIRNCLCCNKEIETTVSNEQKFCNNSCSATYNNKLRGIKNKTHDNKCVVCEKTIRKHSTFCTNTCSSIFKQKERFLKIEKGDKTFPERIYKLFLIEKHGNKCMECGWCKINPVTNKVPIQLEHIDGNSDNNLLNNLKLLCPNCHSLTPTYGSLNKNGRDSKRKEYRKKWRNENNVGDA